MSDLKQETTLKQSGKKWSASHAPSKHRIQLFRDIVVSVFDFVLAKPNNNVRVRLPIRVSWVQVRRLGREERTLHDVTQHDNNMMVYFSLIQVRGLWF